MKPIIKICIALSLILFLLGVTGVGVGMAMGVKPSQLLYSGHSPGRFTIRPELEDLSGQELPDLTDDLSDGLTDGLTDSLSDDLQEIPQLMGENPANCEEYYEFQDIQSFDLDFRLCELHILSHDNDYIAVCADNVQNSFLCRQDGRTLVLKDTRPSSTKSSSMDDALRLDLYLPEEDYKEFCLDLGVGSLTLDLLSADRVEIEQGAGTAEIQTLTCKELDAEIGVGEFLVESLEASKEAEVSMGTGNITIARFDGKNLDLDCAAGNVEITAAGSESDYNYNLNAALGSIYLNHHQQETSGTHHGSHHGLDNCLNIHHGVDRNIQIMCSLGNAELNFTEE